MQILCHCARQSPGNSRLVGTCHGRVDSRESGEAEWLGQGEPGAKLCHAHRHNRLDNSGERLWLFSLSLSLALFTSLSSFSLFLRSSPSKLLARTQLRSPSCLFLCLPLYIFPTFFFLSIRGASCPPSPSHLSTDVTLFSSRLLSSSFPLARSPSLPFQVARPLAHLTLLADSSARFFRILLSSSVFHFFPAR